MSNLRNSTVTLWLSNYEICEWPERCLQTVDRRWDFTEWTIDCDVDVVVVVAGSALSPTHLMNSYEPHHHLIIWHDRHGKPPQVFSRVSLVRGVPSPLSALHCRLFSLHRRGHSLFGHPRSLYTTKWLIMSTQLCALQNIFFL